MRSRMIVMIIVNVMIMVMVCRIGGSELIYWKKIVVFMEFFYVMWIGLMVYLGGVY